jgi:DNA (cytosine-5)-methyltransferase 1
MVRKTIAYLEPLAAGEKSKTDKLHLCSKLSNLNLKRIRAAKPGGTWRDWPPELIAKCHTKKTGKSYPSVYGRMEWDKPSPTITTQCFGFGNGRFRHPEQDRAITLREAALLQTFPANYQFIDPNENLVAIPIGRLIGNAVPINLEKL